MILPQRRSGRQSEEEQRRYQGDLQSFCDRVLQIKCSLDLTPGSRGWCYILEQEAGLKKSDFDKAQALITQCRKDGLLPLDIVTEDGGRVFRNKENLDYEDVKQESKWRIDQLWNDYYPISFWEDQDYYIQMLVEKVDLLVLFHPVCKEYHIPIANAGGWADVSQRGDMMKRFKKWEWYGKKCVLLYCGDHDPAGLNISETLQKNLEDLSRAAGWYPDDLIIDRFGLNYDFIKTLRLSWIDNLITSRKGSDGKAQDLGDPRHHDHFNSYVQDYKRMMIDYGEVDWKKKCEANALVVRPKEGRELCREAIHKYISKDSINAYEAKLRPHWVKLQKTIMAKLKKIVRGEK
jgi:hypothetical protein